jgi:hypothetical protein
MIVACPRRVLVPRAMMMLASSVVVVGPVRILAVLEPAGPDDRGVEGDDLSRDDARLHQPDDHQGEDLDDLVVRSQPLCELVERRPVRDLVGHHPVVDHLPHVESDEPVVMRLQETYQVQDAPHALQIHQEECGEDRAGRVSLRTRPLVSVWIDYAVDVREVVVLEE